MTNNKAATFIVAVSLAAALLASASIHAVVIRQDVPDSNYVVPDQAFPALVDLPGEGHGVLISSRWVVTAAHATAGYMLDRVSINGVNRTVAAIIRYPGFKKLPMTPNSGDAAPLMATLASLNDIALIKLTEPVRDVSPIPLYRGSGEQGKVVLIYGKGATGNGAVGQYAGATHRGKLRRAYNIVISAEGRWINYRFDCGPHALSLEGVMGDGDSGGPVLIDVNGTWELAGLTSWKHWSGDLSDFRPGVCGQTFSNVRISHYVHWIDRVMHGSDT